MPAIDQCEPQVIRAFEKAGWVITHQPFAIRIDKHRGGYIYADLRLRQAQEGQTIIVVEVKCFSSTRTHLDEFYQAVGQYIVYRNALFRHLSDTVVYLAVPHLVYETFFQEPLIQSTLQNVQVNVVVIDLEKEELVQWIS